MHVCHVTVGAPGSSRQNGVLIAVAELLREQSKLTSVQCVAIVNSKRYSPDPRITCLRLGYELLAKVRELVDAGDVFFHLHGALNYQLHLVGSFLSWIDAPYCVSPHGAFSNRQEGLSMHKRAYIRRIVGPFLERASFVHVFGEADKCLLSELGIHPRYVLAPNGVSAPVTLIRDQSSEFATETIRLGYCGRVSYAEKGLELIPDVLATLARRGVPASFDLIGTGPDLERLQKDMRRQGVSAAVTYHGARFGEEKFRMLRNIDVFLQPSRHEGMPLAPLEAMASGARIVMSREANLDIVLRNIEGVFVLDSRDATSWADAIVKAAQTRLNHTEIGRLFDTELSWAKIAQTFISAYRSS